LIDAQPLQCLNIKDAIIKIVPRTLRRDEIHSRSRNICLVMMNHQISSRRRARILNLKLKCRGL
jgi:hypothetical protein